MSMTCMALKQFCTNYGKTIVGISKTVFLVAMDFLIEQEVYHKRYQMMYDVLFFKTY